MSVTIEPFTNVRQGLKFEASEVAVGAGLTDLCEVPLGNEFDTLLLEVANAANPAVALTDFAILLKTDPNGAYFTYLSGTDFDATNNVNLMFCTASGPHELAAGAKAQTIVNVRGAYSMKLQAAGNTAKVTVRGTLRRA